MIQSLRWPPPAARHVAAWAVASILLAPCSAWAETIIPVDLPASGAEMTELVLPTPIGMAISGDFNPLIYHFNEPRFLLFETGFRPSTLEFRMSLVTTGQGQVEVPADFRLLDGDGQTTLSDETQFFGLGDEFVGSAQIIANVFDDRVIHALLLEIDARNLQGQSDPGDVTGGTVTLSVTGFGRLRVRSDPFPGDFDGDGDVDGADFVVWQTNFPTATDVTLATGDADGDGDVDGADFVIWQTNFPFTPAPAAAPVPEPAAWLLAIFSLAGLAPRFRRETCYILRRYEPARSRKLQPPRVPPVRHN